MKRIKRLIGETNNVILGVGALATAVVAVVGAVRLFQPDPPPAGILADIEGVSVETNVGLEEFIDREQTADVRVPGSGVLAPAGYTFAAYTAADGATEPATETGSSPSTSTPASTPEHTTTPSTTPHSETHKRQSERATEQGHTSESEGGDSGTQTSTHVFKRTKVTESTTPENTAAEGSSGPSGVPFVKPPAAKTPFKSEGNAKTLSGTGAPTSEVEGVLAEATTASSEEATTAEGKTAARIALPQHCGSSCPAGPIVEQVLADNKSPAQAARKVAAVFRNSRARYYDHELHPLGADVEYTLKLTGFVHNDAILEWTLWSQSEHHPLPHSWWQKVIVKQVKPSRYEETVSGTFWAPLPPKPGNYVFHLAVYDEQGNRRGHGRTPVFH
ncbi:MAG TPA: hypothetical protein VGI24_08830 [Solirubrobacteraceae bacterium]|jgi:hypothetical protein